MNIIEHECGCKTNEIAITLCKKHWEEMKENSHLKDVVYGESALKDLMRPAKNPFLGKAFVGKKK